jgi:acyl carrier protein
MSRNANEDTVELHDIENALITIVRARKKYQDVALTRTTLLSDVGIDSLDALNILFDIEERFDISIPDEQARRIRTVGDMIDIVAQLAPAAS